MINPNVVKLAVEYLDQCMADGNQATLAGMHWYIDSHHRVLPLVREVNEALNQRPGIFVRRENNQVLFVFTGI